MRSSKIRCCITLDRSATKCKEGKRRDSRSKQKKRKVIETEIEKNTTKGLVWMRRSKKRG